jgi:oligoendopeptidase F
MGHAIHAELSKKQTPMYQGYTMAVAETASTFFEAVVFNRVFATLDHEEKIIALHDRINRDVSTIFRQIACFNFEKELHATIREEGSLSHENMAELMNKHMKNYLGDRFALRKKDGYFFVHWSHLRRPFYVYTYAYGDLISKAMHEKFKEDDAYINEVKQFLQAGSAKTPQNIFADIDIDTTSQDVFAAGLRKVREDIESLKSLM